MAVRLIDGDELLGIERLLDTDVVRKSKTASWLLDQVLHDIQAMPTLTPQNEWVRVDERLPTDERPVLVFIGYADTMTGFITTSSYFCFDVNPHWQWDGFLEDEQRTLFWMPLPAPPGEDNNVPANEPLTLEQLRQMDGEPVYIPEIECWALVKREQFTLLLTFSDGKQCPASEWYEQVGPVYRRPPEGGEINKITVVQHLGRPEDVALRPVRREQVEKAWAGCEYCEKHKINLVRIEMNYNDSPGSPKRLNPTRVPKFCPMCGRPLTDEAVEMVMERLEALHEDNSCS